MHVQPHENLMVWTIRHDLFDTERFQPSFHHHHLHLLRHNHEALRAGHFDRWHHRLVDHLQRTEPDDCRPWQCDDEAYVDFHTSSKAYPSIFPPMPEVDLVTVPADIAPPSEPGALQGYIYGQAVPTSGNLLDVMA